MCKTKRSHMISVALDKFMRKKEYWLVTTEHLEDRLLFKDADDFRVGMNYVAVMTFKCQVIVLAFILMSNHLHFVLYCTREQAERFITAYKQLYSRYLQTKYGNREYLRGNGVDIRLIPPGDEALEKAIAYVLMNCVAANICSSPRDYPWGTGSVFFNGRQAGLPMPEDSTVIRGSTLASISAREQRRLIHSNYALPGEWIISDAGYILPFSYVRKDLVENAFGSPRRMNYFLQNSSKAKQRLETGELHLPAFRDQVIASSLPDLCWSLFRKQQVSQLSEDQMVELMRQLRFRFSANVNQIARVTGMSYEEAAIYMDRA